MYGRDDSEEDEPEPEENVELLVDDILRKDADTVVRSLLACSAVVGQAAHCHNGKHSSHRVKVLVLSHVFDYLNKTFSKGGCNINV